MNAPFTPDKQLKLIKIGNSVGIILPKDILAKLGVDLDDFVDVTENPEVPAFAVMMKVLQLRWRFRAKS